MKKILAILLLFCCGILSAQTYRIGDLYTAPDGSRGVVYYIHPDGSGGWVVALTDASMGCTWGDTTDVPGLTNHTSAYFQNLLNDTAGFANTQTLRSYQNNDTSYAAGKVDFEHGWILPSPEQLRMLYGRMPFIITPLTNLGTNLAYSQYWCSSENSGSDAWCVEFGANSMSGSFIKVSKTTSCCVRAVRSFIMASVVHDTALTYQWNTGSTQPYINVSPGHTASYTVTATTNYGCSATAEQTVIVGTGSVQTIYDTVCQGTAYEANGFTLTELETDTMGTLTRSRMLNNVACSSTLNLNLTVYPRNTIHLYQTACEQYEWNGVTYYESGDYLQYFNNRYGCDSVVVLHLTLYQGTHNTVYVTACNSYQWHGATYTFSGIYTYDYSNANGCASTDTLCLTMNYGPIGYDTLILVENQLPYYFAVADTVIENGAPTFSEFSYHWDNGQLCDSTIMQTVIIHYNTSQTIDTTVCLSSLPYSWHNHQFIQAGSFSDTALNVDGSNHLITLQLNVSNPAVTEMGTSQITCFDGSDGQVQVLVSGGVQPYSYHWENAAGTTLATTAQLSNRPAGTYTLYVSDAIGCTTTQTVNLTHLSDSMVPGVIANDQSVCAGHQPSAFTGTLATGGASSTYQWQVSTDGTNWTPAPIPNNTRNYTYPNALNAPISLRRAWVSTACGTVYSNMVTVNVLQNYSDTITASVCQGYPYQGNGFNISAEATASPGTITSLVHLQTESGCDSMVTLLLTVQPSTYSEEQLMICKNELPFTYNDTVFDVTTPQFSTVNFQFTTAGGCDSVVVLHLTVNPMYEQDLNDMICEGESYNQNGFVVSSAQTQGLTELDLTQQLQSYVGCDSVVNLHLTIVDDAISIVSLTDDFCEEYVAELSVESHLQNYMWSTGETSQTITVTRPGVYTVTASEGQCSVSVSYQIEACELNVYLPNAITPGLGDGINDYFCIHDQYKPMIEDFEIRIYSRWGELVYYSKDKDFKWNGEIKGRIIRQVIYTYMITFTDSRGIPYQLTGSITVL